MSQYRKAEEQRILKLCQRRDTQVVPDLINALESSDLCTSNVIVVLGEIKDKRAVPVLIPFLDSWLDRRYTAKALGNIGDISALPALIKSLKYHKHEDEFRKNCIEAICKFGKAAVPNLLKALKEKNKFVVVGVFEALGEIGDKSVIPVLKNSLKSDEKFLHLYAAEALIKLGNKTGISILVESLKSKIDADRIRAVKTLSSIADKMLINPLIQALGDSEWKVRKSAVNGLKKIGKPDVTELIKGINSKNWRSRGNIIEVLTKINDKSALPIIIKALND